ncbi:MAG: histidine acid phosphatase [Muribaculaceae bacterium]|nr:histidine acid phosphatase [Muribaculaceae bacterium]
MKQFTLYLLLAITCLSLGATTPRKQVINNFDRSASNHYAYPYGTDLKVPTLTAAPAGYEPFYIDHYGRHGSRWLTNGKYYERPCKQLKKAQEAGMLNLQGKLLLRQLTTVYENSKNRAGDLSDEGAIQHQEIAQRMFNNFPEVFAGNARIDARSTVIIRCILSMQNETMRLRSLNPELRITTDASYHDMYYMGWGYGEDTLANDLRKSVDPISNEMYAKHLDARRFVAQLVNDTAWASANMDGVKLMRDVFDIAGSLQGHHQFDDINLFNYFSNDEIFELWRMKNIYWYIHWANAPQNGNRMPFIERALLRNMIATADDAIATGERGAALRFGHETCVLPLACLLELDNVNYSCDDLETLHEHWQDYNTIPKACNIQMVFYRPAGTSGNRPEDILVKVLFNEHEATLPATPVQGPYYRWTDLKRYYENKLATSIDWSVK